jgi:myo-inositol-1(or 4)-monophosphatase
MFCLFCIILHLMVCEMDINYLRDIGRRLFSEVGRQRLRPFSTKAVKKGAGGDKSFPIDIEAEDIIISSLKSLDEPLSIISEEIGTFDVKGGGRLVIIDPIDGSKNAVSGVPFYCTSIAVADSETIGSMSSSYIINLLTGDEFWAEKGKGAFFNGEQIFCQQDDILYFVAYEAQMPGRDIPRIMPLLAQARKARCFGSLALDLSYVAYGAFSIFAGPVPSRIFDFAGGYLLVKEAGGVITDMNGNSIDGILASMQDRIPLLAAGNQKLHLTALEILNG